MEIEDRAYGPDSSDEDIQILRNRVKLYEKDIILFKELPVMTDFSIKVTTDEIATYLNSGVARYIIIDLVGVPPPSALIRAKLKEYYSQYTDQIEHMAFFTGKNALINLVAKYMVRTIGYREYSFHKTKEQALKAIKNG